jgi:outer membrane protein assembly factor BamE (lipoprotein component of BamABCDE complex)
MKKIFTALFIGIALSSCVPSTPQARIEKFPEKFAALSQKEQALVQHGEISRGMSKDAVLLAWGTPAQRFEGYENSRKTERWDYTKSRAVHASHYSLGYGYSGYGPYNRRGGYSSFGFAIGPDFVYVPTHAASVWFDKNSWERAR